MDGLRVAATAGREGPVAILDGVSLRVARGECVGIVGESGSGKSLAMRAVAGLLPRARPSPEARCGSAARTCSGWRHGPGTRCADAA
ncbi:ATP-binding cassette domain-containing protein [Streptomyces sp. M10(2022)]